ncbi:hypothetical protein [Thermosulfurimonas dismutans]|uniref:Uncharacterized protein n=1 Tax=Thermosulfurimonas dismutans TaxID=999894 RepID=A0A179D4F7_9BACT|nr:hypothetical protein [Thermosulfurimonas dismutans]OAQ20974.1 hypothetical protein TDIS_0900 [Thermosulfurimonas dismutans]
MKKVMGIFLVLGVLMLGGWAFSQEGGESSYPPSYQKSVPSWVGPMWHYCEKVNPKSKNCQKMMEMMWEHWQKMKDVRAKVWQEMEEYCQKHKGEELCKNMKGWNNQKNCPCFCKGARSYNKRWHRMRMEGC